MDKDSYLFAKEDGSRFSDSKALGKVITRCSKFVGLPYTPHTLRRLCAKNFVIKDKVPHTVVARHLGHAPGDISTLLSSYCIIDENEVFEAIKNVGSEEELADVK